MKEWSKAGKANRSRGKSPRGKRLAELGPQTRGAGTEQRQTNSNSERETRGWPRDNSITHQRWLHKMANLHRAKKWEIREFWALKLKFEKNYKYWKSNVIFIVHRGQRSFFAKEKLIEIILKQVLFHIFDDF